MIRDLRLPSAAGVGCCKGQIDTSKPFCASFDTLPPTSARHGASLGRWNHASELLGLGETVAVSIQIRTVVAGRMALLYNTTGRYGQYLLLTLPTDESGPYEMFSHDNKPNALT